MMPTSSSSSTATTAPETTNWGQLPPYTKITSTPTLLDTGQTIVNVSAATTPNTNSSVWTTGSGDLQWGSSYSGARGILKFDFKDDATDGYHNILAENITFSIKDIDAGRSSFRDRVIIRAYDENGNQVPVTATTGSGITTSTPATGGLQLLANLGTSSNSLPSQAANITIAGPVARYEIEFFNDGINSNDIFITDTKFTSVATPICFLRGTMILTKRGEVPVENLEKGDMVFTKDHGLKPISWIGSQVISSRRLTANPGLQPVRIGSGALGTGIPSRDLLVSPQHRILVRSKIAQKIFGTPEILVAAKQLCHLEGIDIAHDIHKVEYFHFLFDCHEVVVSNGAETESLYTGAEALKSVGRAARQEIFDIFPQLEDEKGAPIAARYLASGRMGRKLAVRHRENRKPLVSTKDI